MMNKVGTPLHLINSLQCQVRTRLNSPRRTHRGSFRAATTAYHLPETRGLAPAAAAMGQIQPSATPSAVDRFAPILAIPRVSDGRPLTVIRPRAQLLSAMQIWSA